jgi:hypothetical protein
MRAIEILYAWVFVVVGSAAALSHDFAPATHALVKSVFRRLHESIETKLSHR